MIFDVSEFSEFKDANLIQNYWALIQFFSKFDKAFYKQRHIYIEKHHIYPKAELDKTSNKILDIVILLPWYFHFKVHLLRALEYEQTNQKNLATINWSAAAYVLMQHSLPKIELQKFIDKLPTEYYVVKEKQNEILRSKEKREKISKALKGKPKSEEHKRKIGENSHKRKGWKYSKKALENLKTKNNKGWTRTAEQNEKVAIHWRGSHWYNNGIEQHQYLDSEIPDGYILGLLPTYESKVLGTKWYNNGKISIMRKEGTQPEGFVLGRLR